MTVKQVDYPQGTEEELTTLNPVRAPRVCPALRVPVAKGTWQRRPGPCRRSEPQTRTERDRRPRIGARASRGGRGRT